MQKDLSIVIITMNRCEQLMEAIDSCLGCVLPDKTEFVVINNGSTDNTENELKKFCKQNPDVDVNYYSSNVNLGVGGGRTLGFKLAAGKILYFLDDDAVIDPECKNSFFVESIQFFENHSNVASITTRIYDEVFQDDRDVNMSSTSIDGLPCLFKYLGGSHFLRKKCFSEPLYFNIQYGSEEYAPSIIAQDKGFCHVYDAKLRIIHKPKVNKWVTGTDDMRYVLIRDIAVAHATKRILYPSLFGPLLWLGYMRRCSLYLKDYKGAVKEADRLVKKIKKENKSEKIRIGTVIRMYKQFGLTTF